MKNLFNISGSGQSLQVIGIEGTTAISNIPTKVTRDTDPAAFESLFRKVSTASKKGKVGLRLNSKQQKIVKNYLEELDKIGYQIVSGDLKWASGDNIAIADDTDEDTSLVLDPTPEPQITQPQPTVKPIVNQSVEQKPKHTGFLGSLEDKL